MRHKRNSYQTGSLTTEPRKNGPDMWVFRWREQTTDGSIVRPKEVVGSVKQFPTKASAQKACMGLQMAANTASTAKHSPSLSSIADHYRREELIPEKGKRQRTREVYEHQLRDLILPTWGSRRVSELKPAAIEKWLQSMSCSNGSKAKTKGVFSALVRHAVAHDWASSNPLEHVRQSAVSSQVYQTLNPIQVQALLVELRGPFRCLVYTAAVTGLRRGELFGLRWEDVDFAKQEIHVRRSLVDQVEGPPKTVASRKPIPLSPDLAEALQIWKAVSKYGAEQDWVFASPHSKGRLPYWPDAVLKRHVRPAAIRAGLTEHIGWHCFRRTLATLLVANGENVKVSQELLRHSSAETTLSIYAQAVDGARRDAQQKVASMFKPASVLAVA